MEPLMEINMTRVQVLDMAVCVSRSAYVLGKGINLSFLPSALSSVDWAF